MYWTSRIHDQSQIEFSLSLGIEGIASAWKKKAQHRLDFEIFLFAPRSFAVSADTYHSANFVDDLQSLMRLASPSYDFCRAADLRWTQTYLDLGVQIAAREAVQAKVLYEVKIFGSYIKHEVVEARGQAQLEKVADLIGKFRRDYVVATRKARPSIAAAVFDAFALTDEFVSNSLYAAILLQQERGITGLEALQEAERAYRCEHFLQCDLASTDETKELYSKRVSKLKKYMGECLFIRLTDIKYESFYKNVIAGVAAAFAAIFANLTRLDQFQGANDYGVHVYTLFLLAVLAYVFKDRIKDLSKEYFNTWFRDHIPDRVHVMTIAAPFHSVSKEEIGKCYEYFRSNDWDSIPDDVAYLQQTLPGDRIPIGRDLFHYRKKILVQPYAMRCLDLDVATIKDTFRFNMSTLVRSLDDPERTLILSDEQGFGRSVAVARNYYFDLIIRSTDRATDGAARVRIEAIRLVVNKLGILRLESLLRTGYSKVLTEEE